MFFSESNSGSDPGPGIFFVTGILSFIFGPCIFLFLIFLVIQQCRKKMKCRGWFSQSSLGDSLGKEKLLNEDELQCENAELRATAMTFEEQICLY
uniref:Uncharacterized protein n=1 Tax=Mustela putorius furo TaxID=9669 RepID=M3YZ88_MUSPF